MERRVVVVVRGEIVVAGSVEEALSAAGGSGVVIESDCPIRVRVVGGAQPARQREEVGRAERRAPSRPRVAVVLDQMFRGLGETVARELGPRIEVHEVLGRGLEKPVRQGRVTRWPARDDYDVMKIVEELAGRARVLFATGDKRLARQVESLGLPGVVVAYMPPNEYPGKESIIREIVRRARSILYEGGDDSDGDNYH